MPLLTRAAVQIALAVLGDGSSSPYGSLAAALSPIELATSCVFCASLPAPVTDRPAS